MTNDDDVCNDKEKKIFGRFCHFLAAAIDFFQYQIDVTLSSTLHTEVRQMTKLLSFDMNEKKNIIDDFKLVFMLEMSHSYSNLYYPNLPTRTIIYIF